MTDLLSEDELTALRQGVATGTIDTTPPPAPGEVRTFALGSDDHVGRTHLPAMQLVNERFARTWRVGLFNLLRRPIDVKFTGVDTVRYDDYARALDVPTHLTLTAIKPLRGVALVMCQPRLIYQMVDQFYGGSGKHPVRLDNREFTKAEQRVIDLMLKQAYKDLAEAWQPLKHIECEALQHEANPRFANVIGPREFVVVCRFSINLDGNLERDEHDTEQADGPSIGGEVHVAYPFAMLDAIRDELEAGSGRAFADNDDGKWRARMGEQLLDAELELSAVFAQRRVTLADVLRMKVGDVLPLSVQAPMTVDVESVPLFAGEFGNHRNNQAIKVTSVIARPTHPSFESEPTLQ